MTILDKRNRLFGKIHILYIGLPLLAIVSLFTLLSLYGRSGTFVTVRIKGGPGNWWWVTPRPPEWYTRSLKVGDVETDSLGRAIATVEDVQIYESGGPNKDVYLLAKLRASYNPLNKKYKYKGQSVQIGAPITLELGETLFSGNIIEIDVGGAKIESSLVEKTVVVRLYNAYVWEYDAITIGETMTDGSGNVIAEIVDKYQRPPNFSVVYLTDRGNLVFDNDPDRLDITVTLTVKAREEGQVYVFREEQHLKVGKSVWAFFPSYDIAGARIIAVEDAKPS